MPSTPDRTPSLEASAWPEAARDRDRFVLDRRPKRPLHDPFVPQGVLFEEERGEDGALEDVVTVFLTGRECPWRCAFCDLWRYTTTADTPVGALPRQVEAALASLADRPKPPRVIKLYNASSFFDPRAVPPADYEPLAARLSSFSRVIVESHPALVGDRVDPFTDALARHRDPGVPSARLEVALGLETADPQALARLHKGMTLDLFAAAARGLCRRGVSVRAFLLVPPPFVAAEAEVAWLRRSVRFAFEAGASVVSLIPTRGGNGALEALAAQGLFRAPRLSDLEDALEAALAEAGGPAGARVFADLWDLERSASCAVCLPLRRERLRQMNARQAVVASVACVPCGWGTAA